MAKEIEPAAAEFMNTNHYRRPLVQTGGMSRATLALAAV
jgi:hypothetical protein